MSLIKEFKECPNVVVIGGGTGISNLLRGLKKYTSNIVAIVTVADDGGGSGILRDELGILPPGDIRNCLIALANTEPIMKELLRYRFKEGNYRNQNFGNLFIAAMIGITNSFEEAIKKVSEVLAITGKVLPVTTESVTLSAELENGIIVKGESSIPKEVLKYNSKVKKLNIIPEGVLPYSDCIDEILKADAVILGPGSLYTSIIPNMKIRGICNAINESRGIKIYVSNVMTQPGETDEYTLCDHVESIFNNSCISKIDYVIANDFNPVNSILNYYEQEGSKQVICDDFKLESLYDLKVIKSDLMEFNDNLIRHDKEKLSEIIMNIVNSNKSLN